MSGYLTIQVTQEHIDAGEPKSAGNCPVALALLEICYDPRVYPGGSMSIRYAGVLRWPISKVVSKFIDRFDRGETVEPFTFRVGI